MNCRNFNKRINRFIKKDLSTRELASFLVHLKRCDECKEELSIKYLVDKSIVDIDDDNDETIDRQHKYDFNFRLKELIKDSEDHVISVIKKNSIINMLFIISATVYILALYVLFF